MVSTRPLQVPIKNVKNIHSVKITIDEVYMYMYIYVYVYMCICVYVCVCIVYVYIYIAS